MAVAVLCLVGACTDPAPPFTYELSVYRGLGGPPVAIDGDATFDRQTWDFANYDEAQERLVLDVTYGDPPQHGEVRPGGCEFKDSPYGSHDVDGLVSQRVTLGSTPIDILAMWCTTESGGGWGFTW
jgi:hypothetical protein